MWLARQQPQRACRDHHLPVFCHLLRTRLRLFSPSAGRCGDEQPAPPAEPTHFIVDYLVRSCGLSRAEAVKASKRIAHLKSPKKPNAVLRLLRQEGLGDAHIKRLVSRLPEILLADAKKTVEPKIRLLQGAEFSGPEIAQLISSYPHIIHRRDLLRRVEFWREVVGGNQNLLKVMNRDMRLLSHNLDSSAIPGLSLLRSLGIPDSKMGALVLKRPRLVSAKPERVKTLIEQVRSLGFSPGSPMFVQAVSALGNLSRSTFDVKCKLLRSFGWTQAELISAIQRFPNILMYSEKKIRATMDFLLKEAGCEPSYIVHHPELFAYSIEKRMRPRCYVLQSLKKKSLLPGSKSFLTAMMLTEVNFVQKYIVRYSDQLPELLDAYYAFHVKNA